ncbi:MAG: hypothetical protein ACRDV8_10370, partial [Acidimicrobiales bacterium]
DGGRRHSGGCGDIPDRRSPRDSHRPLHAMPRAMPVPVLAAARLSLLQVANQPDNVRHNRVISLTQNDLSTTIADGISP